MLFSYDKLNTPLMYLFPFVNVVLLNSGNHVARD